MLLCIGLIEIAFRQAGGFPYVVPGWTHTELQWRLTENEPANTVFVVGDSRVGWGFSEGVFDETLRAAGVEGVRGINAGVTAGNAERIVQFLLKNHLDEEPGLLVVNYSPPSFYFYQATPGTAPANLLLQDLYDERLGAELGEVLYTWDRGIGTLWDRIAGAERGNRRGMVWVDRHVYPDGFVHATLVRRDGKPIKPGANLMDFDRQILGQVEGGPIDDLYVQSADYYAGRREKLIKTLKRALKRDYEILMVRFPLGEGVLQADARLPEELTLESIAGELKIPYIDYNGDERAHGIETVDGSHLSVEGARAISRLLAEDVARLFKGGPGAW